MACGVTVRVACLPVGTATADVPIAVGVPLGKNATNAVGEAVTPP